MHLETFPDVPAEWRDEALAERWAKVRRVRRVVTGALEIERAQKRIGASLEAAPVVHIADESLLEAVQGLDLAEICITSGIQVVQGEGPAEAFRLDDVKGVAVVPALAQGRKCARSWKVTPEVGTDPDYPDVTPRDAAALREWDQPRRRRNEQGRRDRRAAAEAGAALRRPAALRRCGASAQPEDPGRAARSQGLSPPRSSASRRPDPRPRSGDEALYPVRLRPAGAGAGGARARSST